jgi:hypothetical protein
VDPALLRGLGCGQWEDIEQSLHKDRKNPDHKEQPLQFLWLSTNADGKAVTAANADGMLVFRVRGEWKTGVFTVQYMTRNKYFLY